MSELKEKIQWTRKTKMVLLAVLFAVLLLLPLVVTSSYTLHILITCFIYACLTLSLNLIIGWSGQFSLGHVTFYGMGAYITALLMVNYDMNFFLATLVSILGVAVFAAVLYLPTMKLRGDYLAVITLGFGEVFRLVVTNEVEITRGPKGIPGIPQPELFGFRIASKFDYYYFGLLLLVLFVIFMVRINNSGFGLSMFSVNEDDIAATALGINPKIIKLKAFVIGGAMAATMGSFYAVYLRMISPTSFIYNESIKMVSMVVLGGMGSIPGSILGASILGALPEVLRFLDNWRLVIYGAVMVIMMIFRPNGIWGRDKRMKNEYKIKAMKKVSKRGVHNETSITSE